VGGEEGREGGDAGGGWGVGVGVTDEERSVHKVASGS